MGNIAKTTNWWYFMVPKIKFIKWWELVYNLYNKEKYAAHMQALKQTLDHGLKQKGVGRITEFHQKAWLKSYIDINSELRKIDKKWFWNRFLEAN